MRIGRWGRWRHKVNIWLWGPGSMARTTALNWPLRLLRQGWLTYRAGERNLLPLQAAALAFYTLLSMVPFLVLLLAVMKAFGIADDVMPYLLDSLSADNKSLADEIGRYILAAQTITMGGVGSASLLVTGFFVLQRVRGSLNNIWEVQHAPHYGRLMVEYMAVLSITPFLLLGAFTLSTHFHQYIPEDMLSNLPYLNNLSLDAAALTSYPIYWGLLFYAYMFLPDSKVRWGNALVAAVLAGSLLSLAQRFYFVVVVQVTTYEAFYGTLSMLPFLMMWLFLGWMIFLWGAQLTCVSQHYHIHLGRQQRLVHAGASQMPYLALLMLAALESLYRKTGQAVSLKALAQWVSLPYSLSADLINRLTVADLVTEVKNSNHFVPSRPMEQVSVGQAMALMKILPHFPDLLPLGLGKPFAELQQLLNAANQSQLKTLERMDLAHLAQLLSAQLQSPTEETIPATA